MYCRSDAIDGIRAADERCILRRENLSNAGEEEGAI